MLNLIGREKQLFGEDIKKHSKELKEIVSSSSFLVICGAINNNHLLFLHKNKVTFV